MEEIIKSNDIQNVFYQLGTFVANEYVPSDNCHLLLMYVNEKLNSDDVNSRNYRLSIGISAVIKKILIPIMIAVKNDKILKLVIKILVNIMTPIDHLAQIDQLCKDENGYCTVLKHNLMLTTNKIAFINANAIKRIIHIIKENIIKLSSCQGLSSNSDTIIIYDCLCLIKYILQVQSDQYQNHLLWMLFSEKFGKILIELIGNPNRSHWAVLITELIALVFKNQHVDHMTKLLNETNTFVKNSSSEDNESNTSLYLKSIASSSEDEPESDKNDIDCRLNHPECTLNQIPINKFKEKLCDINSSVNQNDNSLNDTHNIRAAFKEPTALSVKCDLKRDDKHHKVFKKYNKKQRKSLINQQKYVMKNKIGEKTILNSTDNVNRALRSRTNIKLNFKIIQKHTPSQECISYFLQKFTVNFLQNGFNTLVDEIYNLITTTTTHQRIDTSLFFWILTYFCRFCILNKIDLKSVRGIVSFKLISYIVHEGFKVSEQLMTAKQNKAPDINLLVRHLHLVIMAIKEVIKTIEFYRQTTVGSPLYMEIIKDIKSLGTESINAWANDLKSLFVLLIRQYDNSLQAIDYLHDLIVANHMIISLFDNLKDCWDFSDSITAHVKKFAVIDIMSNYGTVLQNYKKNDALVNEAVFTMMHHIIGEVENTTVLFQPTIIKTFLKIYEEENNVYQRWSDLVEYVIHKFLQLPKFDKFGCRNPFDGNLRLPSSRFK